MVLFPVLMSALVEFGLEEKKQESESNNPNAVRGKRDDNNESRNEEEWYEKNVFPRRRSTDCAVRKEYENYGSCS